MKKQVRKVIKDIDELDVLSGVWILASNDENPIITYESVRYRLGLASDYPVTELIRSRGELFRMGVPEWRLGEWKDEMSLGKSLPSWLREIESKDERDAKIKSLRSQDVFRSQFRAGYDAPKSTVSIIEWGLTHIERIRKARLEEREQTAKSWQIWLVFITSIMGIIVSLVLEFL
jgi:hypothetical protein